MRRKATFQLQRGMTDGKTIAEHLGRGGEHCIFSSPTGTNEVRRERDVGGAYAPDVQVVHLHYAIQLLTTNPPPPCTTLVGGVRAHGYGPA